MNDQPKITIRTTEGLRRDFRVKCAREGFTQKDVVIELICIWLKCKVTIPGQTKRKGKR